MTFDQDIEDTELQATRLYGLDDEFGEEQDNEMLALEMLGSLLAIALLLPTIWGLVKLLQWVLGMLS